MLGKWFSLPPPTMLGPGFRRFAPKSGDFGYCYHFARLRSRPLDTMIVLPKFRSCLSRSRISIRARGSNPLAGSSSSSATPRNRRFSDSVPKGHILGWC